MLGTELIGWFAEVLGKRPDGVQVQPDRGRRIMPDLEVLQHPLSKWCHSKNSFRCDHITNRLPAEPSTPWNVWDSALHLPEGLCSMVDIRPSGSRLYASLSVRFARDVRIRRNHFSNLNRTQVGRRIMAVMVVSAIHVQSCQSGAR